MNDEQQLVILYLKYHARETAEDVLNALAGDSLGHRLAIANALEYLVWNGYIHKDLVTGELTLKEGAR